MLAQYLILSQNSLCLSLGDQPLMPTTLNVPLDELWDIDGFLGIRASSRRVLFLWKFFIVNLELSFLLNQQFQMVTFEDPAQF